MERDNQLKDTLNELHLYEALLRHELSQNLSILAITNEIIRKLIIIRPQRAMHKKSRNRSRSSD